MMSRVFAQGLGLLVSMLPLVLIGCTKPSQSEICNQLLDSQIKTFPFVSTNANDWTDWIQKTYRIAPSEIKFIQYAQGKQDVYAWKADGRQYGVTSTHYGNQVVIRWNSIKPTLKDVLNCLGEPDYYQAYFDFSIDAYIYRTTVWYPKQGIVINIDGYTSDPNLITFEDSTEVSSLFVMSPGDINTAYSNFYSTQTGDETLSKASLKTWPGALARLERVIDH